MNTKYKNFFNIEIPILTVIIVSFVTIAFLEIIHREQLYNTQLIMGSFDVIERTPPWRVNQNRLMGPVILKLMTLIGFSKWWALRIFALFFVVFNNFLYIKVLSLLSNSKYLILNSLLFFNGLFILSQDSWLYVWDLIDVSFFITYALIIFEKKYLNFLFSINFLHIFNRESFLIMSIFFIFLIFIENNLNFIKSFKNKTVKGLIFNIFFGVAYVYYSRKLLFLGNSPLIGESGDLGSRFLEGQWITPKLNLYILTSGEDIVSNLIIIFSIITLFSYIILNFRNFNKSEKYIGSATLLNVLPVFVFGIVSETRQLFPSIVLLSFLFFSRNKNTLL